MTINHALKKDRLHVMTIQTCNNNCLFCCNRHPQIRARPKGFLLTYELMSKECQKVPELDSILFTGGESTMHSNLVQLIGKARQMGYKTIALQTNGRFLQYKDYCLDLIRHGLTEVNFSLHASSAKIHNALTRTQGAFEESTQGLKNMILLKRKYPLTINTSFTITRLNYKDLFFYLKYLTELKGIDTAVLNTLMFGGNAKQYFKSLAISYTQIALEAKSSIKKISKLIRHEKSSMRISISPMPLCLMKGYESFVGKQESPMEVRKQVAKVLKRKAARIKPECCRGCKFCNECDGVDSYYASQFGTKELFPVKHA